MLLFDFRVIGSKLYKIRTKKFMTRAEVAEKANLSDRTYADIERGTVNMRVETILRVCDALSITPNDILVSEDETIITEESIINVIKECSPKERETALQILEIYLRSLK